MCNYFKCKSKETKPTGKCKHCGNEICEMCCDPKNPDVHLNYSKYGNCYFEQIERPLGYGEKEGK